MARKKKASAANRRAGKARLSKFDLSTIPPPVKKSPIKLRDWLDFHIPWLIGPRIDALEPNGSQRGAILSVQGAQFSTARDDNQVTIGGTPVPVLAATATELKVLVTKDVDTGPVKVTIGTRSATSVYPFTVQGYPGAGDDGPPEFSTGAGDGTATGDVSPIGRIRVMVVVCQATDKVPPNLATIRTNLTTSWNNVHTYYDQASNGRTDVQADIAANAAQLDGVFTDFVDLTGIKNILPSKLDPIRAIAAQQAQNEGFTLNDYQMLCAVVFTAGGFIRAWGGSDTDHFLYDDGKSTTDPTHVHIDISLTHKINSLWINETADWGRFAHEFGHNIVSAPTPTGDGTATLGEDVYGSDLVDSGAATAQDFELMGNHDAHPLFTSFHLEKLTYYQNAGNIREATWDRNPHTEEFDIIAHGLAENTDPSRAHMVKVKVSDALQYFIEVRQRPGTTAQIFDSNIPIGGSANQGGVIVTRVIAGEMHNNQQTRFITLMHDNRVQLSGDIIEDPARALRITVVNDNVQARPQVCKVRVEWANTIANDPNGAFDLNVEPWDGNFQTPDIWVDRDPLGTFENPLDSEGRPTGSGDKPWVNHINRFTARVHVSGAMGTNNVKVTFYAVTPPGVGDNGNWSPIATTTIASIPKSGAMDTFCNWVPVVGKHTCLRAFASQQLGEISGDNNSAQENIFDFEAAGGSPADPLFIKTAIRNPIDERRMVHVSACGVPLGWAAQIPHAWVWLDAHAEKEIDVMIWPLADVNVYKFGKNKEGRFPGVAPVKVAGFIERQYAEMMGYPRHEPGSRFYSIGGTFYRVGVRRKSTIRIETDSEGGKDSIRARGVVSPVRADQRMLVEVVLPDGKTHRTVETKTSASGQFTAVLSIRDATKKLQHGPHSVQAFLHNATELADAELNVVTVVR